MVKVISVATFLVASSLGSVAAQLPHASNDAPASTELAALLDALRIQADRWNDFDLEYNVLHHARSAGFGASMAENRDERAIRLTRSGDRLFVNATAFLPSFTSRRSNSEQSIAEDFYKALESGFQPPAIGGSVFNVQVLRTADIEQYLWNSDLRNQSIAVFCPPGESQSEFKVPLVLHVIEAFTSLCMMQIGNVSVEYELMPQFKAIAGENCQVIQLLRREKSKRRPIREYWVETRPPRRIRRCIILGGEQVVIQCDFPSDGEAIAPDRISLLQLDELGNVYDELIAARSSDRNSAAVQWKVGQPTDKETLVLDYAHRGGTPMRSHGALGMAPDARLRAGARESPSTYPALPIPRRWDSAFIPWFQWPRVTLPLASVFVLYLHQKVRRRRR